MAYSMGWVKGVQVPREQTIPVSGGYTATCPDGYSGPNRAEDSGGIYYYCQLTDSQSMEWVVPDNRTTVYVSGGYTAKCPSHYPYGPTQDSDSDGIHYYCSK